MVRGIAGSSQSTYLSFRWKEDGQLEAKGTAEEKDISILDCKFGKERHYLLGCFVYGDDEKAVKKKVEEDATKAARQETTSETSKDETTTATERGWYCRHSKTL